MRALIVLLLSSVAALAQYSGGATGGGGGGSPVVTPVAVAPTDATTVIPYGATIASGTQAWPSCKITSTGLGTLAWDHYIADTTSMTVYWPTQAGFTGFCTAILGGAIGPTGATGATGPGGSPYGTTAGATDPATCTPAVTGDFWNTTSSAWKYCSATNIWSAGRSVAGNLLVSTTVLGPKTIGAGANQLPAASACTRCLTVVTDAASTSDCTVGSGTAIAACLSNGTIWGPLGSSGAGSMHSITIPISGAPIATGTGGVGLPATANFACTINKAQIQANASGSITIDIWKAAGAIPSGANKISASAPVTLSSSQLNQNSSLTGWTTAVTAGDVFWATVASVDGVLTAATVQIWCQ